MRHACCYLVLLWDNETVYAAVKTDDKTDADILGIVGARVKVSGISSSKLYGQREKLGRDLQIAHANDIQILRKPTDDPFDVPDVTELDGRRPGLRRAQVSEVDRTLSGLRTLHPVQKREAECEALFRAAALGAT